MSFGELIIIFIIGGIIYQLIKTDNSSQILEGAANGFFFLLFLLRKIFPYALMALVFLLLIKACS